VIQPQELTLTILDGWHIGSGANGHVVRDVSVRLFPSVSVRARRRRRGSQPESAIRVGASQVCVASFDDPSF